MPSPLTQLAESLPVIVFETDRAGAWTQVSALWHLRTQQPVNDALGFGWLNVVHDDDRVAVDLQWRAAFELRQPVDVEFRMQPKSSRDLWWRALAAPSLNGEGFIGVIIDSTQRHAAEDEVRRLSERNAAIIASMPDMLFHCSAEGRFLDFHAPADSPLLLEPEAFLGKAIAEVMPAAVATDIMKALDDAAQTGNGQRFEYQLMQRGYEVRVTPMPNDEYLFVVRDVTEMKRFEAELIATREQALEASRLKSQFLATVSHEIRTPLNGILGVAQLLRTMAMPPDANEYLDVLQSSGQSLLDIVNDVLDLSKIEANRLELESEAFDLEELVSHATRAFVPQAAKKGLALECAVAAAANAPCRGDPSRLRQVINNLVGNAIKFTEHGSVRVTVDRDGDTVTLQVSDTGLGISGDRTSAIFDPFVQADGAISRRFGGTGLGLTICRRLVQLMGGDITVESRLGSGSTFRVRAHLPCVVLDRVEASKHPSRVTAPPKQMRVLLAEDNEVNARLTCAIIEKLGHRVEVVSNGQMALDALSGGPFDLVLMDVEMPVIDGLETTRRIRADASAAHRHVPIVALTANAMRGDDLLCLSAGMDAYLPKPVMLDALRDMLVWFGER